MHAYIYIYTHINIHMRLVFTFTCIVRFPKRPYFHTPEPLNLGRAGRLFLLGHLFRFLELLVRQKVEREGHRVTVLQP